MGQESSDMIRPLHIAANRFLEVLLYDFKLKQFGKGCRLEVNFDKNSRAIWGNRGKDAVQKEIESDSLISYPVLQKIFDEFLIHKTNKDRVFELSAEKHNFPFRYASGGTLPIMQYGKKKYFCLIYREIDPIGWNIANGGCDSQYELLNPLEAMERELREELIILDMGKKKRYVLEYDGGRFFDLPEFAAARRLLKRLFPSANIEDFEEVLTAFNWINGPDRLLINMGEESWRVDNCFLTITTKDFGIEIDKIAKINLELTEDVVLVDGEVSEMQPINAVVGLFDVNRFDSRTLDEEKEYIPDIFFYNGKRHVESEFENIFFDFAWEELKARLIKWGAERCITEFENTEHKFCLCPVTWRMIKRFTLISSEPGILIPPERPYEAFISFGNEDAEIAKRVFDYLVNNNIQTFFSEETKNNLVFSEAIDDALDSAQSLIAVATSLKYLTKRWPKFEWGSFHNDILSGRKPNTTKLIPFVSNIDPNDLPRELRQRNAIVFDQSNIDHKLNELGRYLSLV